MIFKKITEWTAMSEIKHKKDNGKMKRYGDGIKCSICGYYLKQSEITSEYLRDNIYLPT